MFPSLVLVALLLQSAGSNSPKGSPPIPHASQSTKSIELVNVKRLFVEDFGTDTVSKQVQAMLVTSLTESKRFVVTEKREKADAFLKGTCSEKSSQEVHAYSEATAAGNAAVKDDSLSTETISSASASVRLVDQEGDVIWTSTQESHGAKYKGATADVADKIVKQLIRDIDKLEKPEPSNPPASK